VLPIGGLKEKILAAHRANLKVVIIPKDNEKDLVDIPPNVLKAVEIVLVENVDEVLQVALADKPEEVRTGEKKEETPVPIVPGPEAPEVRINA